jgi:hypothetical protein
MYFDYIWEGPNLKTQFDTVSPTLERVSIFRGKRGGGGGGGAEFEIFGNFENPCFNHTEHFERGYTFL